MATPDTEKLLLSAVNILLQTINEQALIDDADLEVSLEGQEAVKVLDEVRSAVLSKGWNFNTDTNYALHPDISGFISVPYNIIDITSSTGNIVVREGNLYDKDNQTRKFEEPVDCDIVWDFAFNDISYPLRHYITVRAARVYQARFIGDSNLYTYTKQDEQDALIEAKESEGMTGKYNMLTSNFGVNTLSRG